MAGERSLASLVILTDSVRVLQEHVNTGNVFKTSNSERVSICPISETMKLLPDGYVYDNSNSNEVVKLLPGDVVSSNHKSKDLVKLPTNDCNFGDSESEGLNDKITTNDEIFSSSDTKSEMKLRSGESDSIYNFIDTQKIDCNEDSFSSFRSNKLRSRGVSDSIGNFIDKPVPFQDKQEIDCNEDSFPSFRSNKSMPLKTYSKRKTTESDKQFDGLNFLTNEENLTDLPYLNERKRNVTKDNSSNSQNCDSVKTSVKKSRRSKNKKIKTKSNGKENLKLLRKTTKETVSRGDLDDKSQTECKIPNQKRLQARRKSRNISRNKRNSNSNKSKLEVFKCVTCGKLISKIISVSKYSFRSSNSTKSRKCQKCQIRKNGAK